MSVQWYSLASQQGDSESDLALSKWFLCGAEGCFEIKENLAFVFAEKAASKGLPAGAFAVAYYYELGIGTRKDLEAAKKWYQKALAQGNEDARDRLSALNRSSSLSRAEHEAQLDARLTRKHTQARVRSEAQRKSSAQPTQSSNPSPYSVPTPAPVADNRSNDEISRRNTLRIAEQAAISDWQKPRLHHANTQPAPAPSQPTVAPNVKRYTLTDSSARPPSAPGRPRSTPTPPTAATPPPKKGPATFEEMGIEVAKVKKDADCIIM